MQCILYKIYFWKVFHMYCKLICILYTVVCGQNFILVKSGCYIGQPDKCPPLLSPTFAQSTNLTPYKYPLLLPVESVKKVLV
jgi:hypothetical protein